MTLASVQKIISLTSIPGADNIETASLLGWEVVVKKREFVEGQLVSYIQIDTIVPELPEYEFLRERKFRVRTIKLRKQISQGLIVPLPTGVWKEGNDLTDILEVKKFTKDVDMVPVSSKMPKIWYKKFWYMCKYRLLYKIFPSMVTFNRASFPTNLVSITDEERIQNIPSVLQQRNDKLYVVSEKLDGSSITILHQKSRLGATKFRICSRRFELFTKQNDWAQVFASTNFSQYILMLVEEFKTNNIIVQGEFIGKPQGNRYCIKQDEIRLFNIFVNGIRIKQDIFYNVCTKYGIPCCPFLDTIKLNFTMPEIIAFAEGKSLLNPSVEREGVVFRDIENGQSFKVISNKYLLKNDE